jgi:hypothetical protein
MSEGTPRSPRWKRWIRRILAFVLLAPVLLLLLGNLLLATPWLRTWAGRKISGRMGVEAAVGRVSVTPWGGVTVRDLALRQPPALSAAIREPLLEVRQIRLMPRWEGLLKGRVEISEIHIDGPRAVVAVEMLASLASSATAPPVPAAPPAMAMAAVSPDPTAGDGKPAPPAGLPGDAPPVLAPPAVAGPPAASPVEWPATAWIVITDAGLQLRSTALSGILAEASGLEARIPVAGRPAPSTLNLARVDWLGRKVASGISLPLAWHPPELRVGPRELTFAGLQVKVAAVVGRLPGTPFAIEVTVPPQPLDASPLFQQLQPRADQVEARAQAIGLLKFPSSWQGVAQAVAARPELTTGGEVRRFDEGRAALVLQGGQLHCPDIRLTGEQLSLLGNGRIDGKGQGSAVLRMVVAPGDAQELGRRFTIPGLTGGPVFQPLETPDRVFLDLRWVSYSGGQGVELGAGGPVVPPGELGRMLAPQAN